MLDGIIESACSSAEVEISSYQLLRDNWQSNAYMALVRVNRLEYCSTFLHVNEQAYVAGITNERARNNYLLSRITVKLLLKEIFPEIKAHCWEVRSGVFNQPVLLGPMDCPLSISISHTQNECAVILYPLEHPMGIDLEPTNREGLESVQTLLTKRERQILASCDIDSEFHLPLMWTAKEALSKVLKTGMMAPFEFYEIDHISAENDFIKCKFAHFGQYQSITFFSDLTMLTMVLPASTQLNLQDKTTMQFDLKQT